MKLVIEPKYLVLLISLFLVPLFLASQTSYEKKVTQSIEYGSAACVRIRQNGIWKDLGCEHNVLTDKGKEFIEQELGDSASATTIVANNISLCNATAGCGEPAATWTDLPNYYTSCGLEATAGTYASEGTGNWSITHTFTSTCDNIETNVTGLYAGPVPGTLFAARSFTIATLQKDDQIQIKWYVWVT